MRLINEDDVLNRITNPYERAIVSRWTREAPTIEAVPERKKGRWLRYNALGEPDTGDTFYWQCDKCLKTEKGYMTAWAYCPNCGASMTEGAEDARRNE